MEIVEAFPEEGHREIVLAESSATFVFKNCPGTHVNSKKVKVPETGSEWWIEITEWSEFVIGADAAASRFINACMHQSSFPSNLPSEELEINVKFEMKLGLPDSLMLPLNDQSTLESIVMFKLKANAFFSREMKGIYYEPNRTAAIENFLHVNNKMITECKIECRVEISTTMKKSRKIISGSIGISSVSKHLGQLLDSKDFSDFTIITSGTEFRVHKNILSLASPYFATLFKGDFKENEKNILENDQNPAIFQLILEYVYKGKLPDNLPEFSMDLYEMAHLYQIEDLKTFCVPHVESQEITNENALRVYKFAAEYEFKDLFELSWIFIKMNILKCPKPKPIDRDPLTITEIEEFVKINEEYEKKVEKFYCNVDQTEKEVHNETI